MVDKDLLITEKDKEFLNNCLSTKKDYYRNIIIQVKLRNQIYCEADGFYVYEPGKSFGYLTEADLKCLLEYLTFLNKDLKEEVDNYFKELDKKDISLKLTGVNEMRYKVHD